MTSVRFSVFRRYVRELRERAGRSDRSDGRCSGKGSGFFSLESTMIVSSLFTPLLLLATFPSGKSGEDLGVTATGVAVALKD